MKNIAQSILLTLFLLFPISQAEAQNPKADSLFRLIRQHPAQDSVHARLLFEYATACFFVAPDSTCKYAGLGVQLSQRIKYEYGMMRSLNLMGSYYWKQGQLDKSLDLYRQALVVVQKIKNRDFELKIQSNIGLIFYSLGVPDSALKHMEISLNSARLAGNEEMQAKILSDMGSAFGLKGDYLQSIRCLLQALAVDEKRGSLNDMAITHIRLGNTYSKLNNFKLSRKEYLAAGTLNDSLKNERYELDVNHNLGLLYSRVKQNHDSARYYFKLAYDLAEKIHAEDVIITINVNLGNICYEEKNYPKAMEYYQRAFQSPNITNRIYEQTAVMVNLGKVYLGMGNLREAERFLKDGLALAEKNLFPEFQKNACLELSALASKQNKYKQAYDYLQKAFELNDSIAGKELKEQVAEVQVNYELEKKEAQNRLLVKENEIQEQIIFRQKMMFSASLIIILLIVVLLFVILRSRNKQKALILKLDEQNRDLSGLNQTKDKFFSIVAHDLKSPFNALMGLLTELDESWGDHDESERRRIIHLLKQSSFNTYNLLVNLLDWARTQREQIQNRAEMVSLAAIVNEVFASLETRATMKSQTLINEVPPDQQVFADPQILRSLLINLVNNGIKFTPVTGRIRVFAFRAANVLQVCVEDSGIGIPENEIAALFRIDSSFKRWGTEKEEGTGLGLVMCKEYIKILGGEITVKSTEGQGTTMIITIPESMGERNV